jgi:hypothetical protein
MRRRVVLPGVGLCTLVLCLCAGPAGAISNGEPDGERHPGVGAIVWRPVSSGLLRVLCSGTLVAPDVFLTAGHCTAFLDDLVAGGGADRYGVAFDADLGDDIDALSRLHEVRGIVTNPAWTLTHRADDGDIGILLLARAADGVQPARLPPAGHLEALGARGGLVGQGFTTVGYGRQSHFDPGGPPFFDQELRRNLARPEYSDLLVAITSWGDQRCRALDAAYRIDTESARGFLRNYINLP